MGDGKGLDSEETLRAQWVIDSDTGKRVLINLDTYEIITPKEK